MPKAARSLEEVEAFKENILAHAVELIATSGFDGFSMRKLSSRLGIAAKTIYNYYTNKDELYLAILTKDFSRLHGLCEESARSYEDPMDRVEAMVLAFFSFGIREPNAYNLMFTWHVPKYNEYVGTDMETTARVELDAAMGLVDLFMKAILDCAKPGHPMAEKDVRFILVCFLTQLHGFIASYNNTLLNYVHEDPLSLMDRMTGSIRDQFSRELERLSHQEVNA